MNNVYTRRELLRTCGGGLGTLALHALLAEQEAEAAKSPLAAKEQHFPAKAKSIIWLFMNGGPSQVDTWDYKPELEKHDGQ